jgi:uncharacterized protein (TIGR02145 family)
MRAREITRILCFGIIGISFYSCKPEEIILHGEISGIVTDTTTGQPLKAVHLKLSPFNDTTSTEIDGKYLFKRLNPGDYKIQTSKFPYAEDIKSTTLVSGSTKKIDFALHKNPYPAFSKRYLDFGFDSIKKSFTIKNIGAGILRYSISTTTIQDWITINPNNSEATTETDTIEVTINRSRLSEMKHIENIEIISHVGLNLLRDTIRVLVNGVIDKDENYYGVVTIGNQTWLAENMNIGAQKNARNGDMLTDNGIIEKFCYNDDKRNCDIYGGLYDWTEAMQYYPMDIGNIGTTQGICPVGWHIPTWNEWLELGAYLGGLPIAGGKLKDTGSIWKQPNVGATNESGFSALPGGSSYWGGAPSGEGETAVWWSSKINEGFRVWYNNINFSHVSTDFTGFFSVRCVKNPPEK